MLVIGISSKTGKNLASRVPAKEAAGKDQTGISFPWCLSQEELLPLQEFLTLDRDSRLANLPANKSIHYFRFCNR